MRVARPPRRNRVLVIVGIVIGAAAVVAVASTVQPWWDSAIGQGLDETITNDSGHAITWRCGDGTQVQQPGETEMLSFAISPEDFDGCNYADDIQMCLNEFQPEPGQHVTASYAIKEWACT